VRRSWSADALATARRCGAGESVTVRADSAYDGHATVAVALRAGADVSVTVRADPKVKAAIAAIDQTRVDRHRVPRGGL